MTLGKAYLKEQLAAGYARPNIVALAKQTSAAKVKAAIQTFKRKRIVAKIFSLRKENHG